MPEPPLRWTVAMPTKPGWYWWTLGEIGNTESPELFHVWVNNGVLWADDRNCSLRDFCSNKIHKFWWAGPLDEQPDPTLLDLTPMKVKLLYFKPRGKLYTEGEYTTQRKDIHDIYEEVKSMWLRGQLPGVIHSEQFTVLINVPEHPHNVPHLLVAKDSE